MAKSLKYLSVMMATLFAASCQQDEFEDNNEHLTERHNITAEIENFITEDGQIQDKYLTSWSPNDMIMVFDGNDSGQVYKLKEGFEDTSHGEFGIIEGLCTEGNGNKFEGTAAFYPYNENISIQTDKDGSIRLSEVSFPEQQTISENRMDRIGFPMAAYMKSDDGSLTFKNAGGIIELSLTGSQQVSKLTMTGNADETIAGHATIRINADGISDIAINNDKGNSITVTCESPIQLREDVPTLFHIFLPPTEFKEGLTITVIDTNGDYTEIGTEDSVSINRSQITRISGLKNITDKCILKDGTYSYEEEHLKYITVVNYRQIIMSKDIPSGLLPSIGNIIILPATENAPNGLIGKVTSIQDNGPDMTISTGTATLQETFKELRVRTSLDISSYLESAKDSEGRVMKAISVPTKASGEIGFKKSVPIENDYFEGSLGFSFKLDMNIDISNSKLKVFDVSFEKESGLSGEWTISSERGIECIFADLELKFRPILIPGTPIYIVPILYAEESLSCNGKLKFKADIEYLFEHQTYEFSYRDGTTYADSNNLLNDKDRSFRFNSLEAEAAININTTIGGKLCLYNEDMLSFGMDLSLSEILRFEDNISMNDDNLFLHNPEVELSPEMKATIYCESFLLGLMDMERIEHEIDFDLPGSILNTLPTYSKVNNWTEGNILNVTADVETDHLIKCEEKGFALFEEGTPEPIEHIYFDDTDPNKVSQEVSFRLPTSKKYTAVPYVKTDDEYHYDNGKWVDLGLSVDWARWNVGAESPGEYGNYYAWGETEPKSEYTMENYSYYIEGEYEISPDQFCNYMFTHLGLDISGTPYDAAYVNWGHDSRMPSKTEMMELIQNCTWEEGTYDNIKGCHVIGPKGTSIFIPYSGAYDYYTIRDLNTYGFLWTSTEDTINFLNYICAYQLNANSIEQNINLWYTRLVGLPVRAVHVR